MPNRQAAWLGAWIAIFASLIATVGLAASGPAPRVTGMRLWAGPEGTRLVLDLSAPVRHEVFTLEGPDRIVIDLAGARLAAPGMALPAGQGPVKSVRTGPRPEGLRIVLDLRTPQIPKSFAVAAEGGVGQRLVVELPAAPVSFGATQTGTATSGAAPTSAASAGAAPTNASPAVVTPAARPPASANPVVTAATTPPVATPPRAVEPVVQGRDLIVAIDAGHGGKDPGTHGRAGTLEKDVTLTIARKVAALIEAEDGMRAVLIRNGDQFISLRGRIVRAREQKADMFVSIHADSAPNREASGSSVYVLSLRGATDEAARWLAERENAADLVGGVSLDDKNDVLASVLLDVTQEENLNGSIEAARSVLGAIGDTSHLLRPRVQHAGFIVLKSPDIPSMLVETAFLSNADDERRLRDPAHQQRLAVAIHKGVRRYFYDHPPPGTRVAGLSARERAAGTEARSLAVR